MNIIKCMNSCFCYLSLKLGAYLICYIFIVTSIAIALALGFEVVPKEPVSDTLRGLLVVLAGAHALLFISSCCLLYGLCMEKIWPLVAFIPATIVIAINETVIISYIIINRTQLPNDLIRIAASQSIILVAVIFSALEVFSLYLQWQEDKTEGRAFADVVELRC